MHMHHAVPQRVCATACMCHSGNTAFPLVIYSLQAKPQEPQQAGNFLKKEEGKDTAGHEELMDQAIAPSEQRVV